MRTIAEILAQELGQKQEYVDNVISLIDEGNTIPFIARYRKEMHGTMDDTTLRNLETRLNYLRNLQTRRDEVKKSIENQGKLTEELSAAIDNAATMTEVEDLYRPYKQKRRTRASVAREKVWNRWPPRSLPRTGRILRRLPPVISMRKRASILWKKPWLAPLTSSPRTFPTMPPSVSSCGSS